MSNIEPGPASSVEDRSLRNIRPRGPRFESRRGLFFSDAIFRFVSFRIFAQMFDGNLQHRTSYIIFTQLRSKAVATSLLSEEERSLENRSYDVIISQSDVIYIYSTTIFYKYDNATCYNNSSQILPLAGQER